jgi:hypothetical protein
VKCFCVLVDSEEAMCKHVNLRKRDLSEMDPFLWEARIALMFLYTARDYEVSG